MTKKLGKSADGLDNSIGKKIISKIEAGKLKSEK